MLRNNTTNKKQEDWTTGDAEVYFLEGKTPCWKCHRESTVVAITLFLEGQLSPEFPRFLILNYVTQLPARVGKAVKRQYDQFRTDGSQTDGYSFLNHCEHCTALLSDFYLHQEPDGCFCVFQPEEATTLKLIQTGIHIEGRISNEDAHFDFTELEFGAVTSDEWIWENANRPAIPLNQP